MLLCCASRQASEIPSMRNRKDYVFCESMSTLFKVRWFSQQTCFTQVHFLVGQRRSTCTAKRSAHAPAAITEK